MSNKKNQHNIIRTNSIGDNQAALDKLDGMNTFRKGIISVKLFLQITCTSKSNKHDRKRPSRRL